MLNCPSQEKGLSFHLFKPTSVSFKEFFKVSLKRFCIFRIRFVPKYFVFPVATVNIFFPFSVLWWLYHTKATGFVCKLYILLLYKRKYIYVVLSRVRLSVTPRTAAHQPPLSVEFSIKNTGAGCHFLLQEIFPTQG